jgi:ATP-dependent Clp protease ATP-binding subunit ClpC
VSGYNFTERARHVFALSREEAFRLGRRYVDADHVVLGIIREGQGVGAAVLQTIAPDLAALAGAIEATLPVNVDPQAGPSDMPFTARAKRVFAESMAVATELGHAYVGTEHLLLGCLRVGEAYSTPLLIARGVTYDRARDEVLRLLGDPRAD